MEIRKTLLKIGSLILTAVWTYSSVLDILDRYRVSPDLSSLTSASYGLIVAFAGLTAFPLWLGYYLHAWIRNRRTVIKNRTFEYQKVNLEGHSWIACSFKTCNLIMERGNYDVIGCNFTPDCHLEAVGGATAILKIAKLFFPQVPLIEKNKDSGEKSEGTKS